MPRFKPFLLHSGIFIALLILFGVNIGRYPIWYDEGFSIFESNGTLSHIIGVCKWDSNPPGYLILLHPWLKVFGLSEVSARFPSAIFMAFSGSFLFHLIRRYFSTLEAVAVLALFAFSNLVHFYAQEARTYAFVIALTLLSTQLLCLQLKNPRYWLWVILQGVIMYVLFMSHYLTAYIFAFQALAIILLQNYRLILSFAASIGIFICAVVLTWFQRVKEMLFNGERPAWIKPPGIAYLKEFLFSYTNSQLAFILVSVIFIAFLFYLVATRFKPVLDLTGPKKLIFYYAFFANVIGLPAVYLISGRFPIFLDRYFLHLLPFQLFLWVFMLSVLLKKNRVLQRVGLAILIGVFLSAFKADSPKNNDYRSPAQWLLKNRKPGETIIVQNASFLFAYYYDRECFKDDEHLEECLAGHQIWTVSDSSQLAKWSWKHTDRIFLVRTLEDLSDPQETLLKKLSSEYTQDALFKNWKGMTMILFQKNVEASK